MWAYIQKAAYFADWKPQIILDFPQKLWLRMQKFSHIANLLNLNEIFGRNF